MTGADSTHLQVRRPAPQRGLRIAGTVLFAALLALSHPLSVQACAACYGKSDAPMARGMNWGILSLLCVVGMVLGILSTFFVFLAKKSATVPVITAATAASEANNQIKT